MQNVANPTYKSSIFQTDTPEANRNNFQTTNSVFFKAQNQNPMKKSPQNQKEVSNVKEIHRVNAKGTCPCCANKQLARYRSMNKENKAEVEERLAMKMVTEDERKVKISQRRSVQVKRDYQRVERSNRRVVEARKKRNQDQCEKAKRERLQKETIFKEMIELDKRREVLDNLGRQRLQREYLAAQLESKKQNQVPEQNDDYMTNSMQIGTDPVDHRDEIRKNLESQIEEKKEREKQAVR